MSDPIRVLLADDHSLVRKGFRRMLEDDPAIEVVGEAANGPAAVEAALELKPQVIVMDLAMPELDGIQATTQILRQLPSTGILILSMYSEDTYIRNAFAAGVLGYLLKNALEVDLPYAIKEVAAGRRVLAPGLSLPAHDPENDFDKLTQRERQVLQFIVQGKSNREIATILGLSVNTISVHRANLMQALGIHRTADLVVYAIQKGLVTLPEPPRA
ncbi:MAG: response regulator transcription factor [Bryobacteraceae bacterium]|jgi:DNA-binding NarL/FixJ family response regulator|nr:response regulator transcription factor [Bryobacteraceae bacterium]HAX43115.1 DNA-binding response regulator [Bryobacterales bacterium]HRJ17553.1 response regulator transcription factor [Bryobacteraceae bacterium]